MGNKVLIKVLFTTLLLVFMVWALALTGCAALKIKASVAGYVYMNEKLMPNFTVQLWDGETMVAENKTNNQGHFIIQDVPPGHYAVRILTFSGVPHAKTFEITVRPGRTETAEFDLGGQLTPEPKPGM